MKIQSLPQQMHLKLELKACYVKIGKIGDACLLVDTQYRKWAFDTIKATQLEIKQLKLKLAISAAPFTALKYRP